MCYTCFCVYAWTSVNLYQLSASIQCLIAYNTQCHYIPEDEALSCLKMYFLYQISQNEEKDRRRRNIERTLQIITTHWPTRGCRRKHLSRVLHVEINLEILWLRIKTATQGCRRRERTELDIERFSQGYLNVLNFVCPGNCAYE